MKWLVLSFATLVLIPAATLTLKDVVAAAPHLQWVANIRDEVLGLSGLLLASAGILHRLVNVARKGLRKLESMDRRLTAELERQTREVESSHVAEEKISAERDLQQRKQAVLAAEAALADAENKLAAAREAFENDTARGRLNAFIRSKVTDGDYARHLGIIAAIRRDFGQLTALMHAANDAGEERLDRERLTAEARSRVEGFLERMLGTDELRITTSELVALFSLLEPEVSLKLFDEWSARLGDRMDDEAVLDAVREELQGIQMFSLPKFSRIVLYIDDLDRCPPEKVVEVLQAVHLLLCFPLFVVVVAVDARWVSGALHDRFPQLLAMSREVEGRMVFGATAGDYLEKIFQIPYWVRPMDDGVARRYVNNIASRDLEKAFAVTAPVPGTIPLDVASPNSASQVAESVQEPQSQDLVSGLSLTSWEVECLEAFAPLVGGTPRRALRFVNVYRLIKTSLPTNLLRKLVGERGESSLYQLLIAQLAVVTSRPDAAANVAAAFDAEDPDRPLLEVVARLVLSGETSNRQTLVKEFLQSMTRLQERLADSTQPLKVADFKAIAPIVSRYSFGQ